jgi:hypothetical protein
MLRKAAGRAGPALQPAPDHSSCIPRRHHHLGRAAPARRRHHQRIRAIIDDPPPSKADSTPCSEGLALDALMAMDSGELLGSPYARNGPAVFTVPRWRAHKK